MLGYTLAQMKGYLDAIGKAEKARLRGELMVLRTVWADQAGFDEALKALGST